MLFTSRRTTALNHILVLSTIFTSPTTVALGAIKQSLPNLGNLPSTGRIVAIAGLFCFYEYTTFGLMSFNSTTNSGGLDNRRLFLQHVAQTSPNPLGLEIARAEGIYLYDPSGKEYIDLIGGITVCNTGRS